MNPVLVGIIGAVPRLVDAFSDPFIGYSSDNTRTRYGRRRPFIFFGAIFSGIFFILMFQLYKGHSESFYFWYFLGFQCLFIIAFACYSIPWIALGYEMTPDYHERTRLQGFSNFFAQIAWLIAPWFFKIMDNKSMFTGYCCMAHGPSPSSSGSLSWLGAFFRLFSTKSILLTYPDLKEKRVIGTS